MEDQTYWGATMSLSGNIQALGETCEIHRQRADLAERKLARIRTICRGSRHYVFNGNGTVESITKVIKAIIDGNGKD